MRAKLPYLLLTLTAAAALHPVFAQQPERTVPQELLGAWDLTIGGERGYPSWLGIHKSGYNTLVGAFVGRGGSARPVAEIKYEGDRFNFSIPKQWERGPNDIKVEGQFSGGKITGRYGDENGKWTEFVGLRAPELHRASPPTWGEPIELFNGKNLDGWKARHGSGVGGWVVEDGLLRNAKPSIDLVSERKFDDFKLHVEFRYPKGSNSGVYLRGRYEAQIEDNYGRGPDSHYIGGIYGFLTPRVNAAKPAGEWQTLDITLVGRILTLALNGEPVIERQAIPGITGGALDSKEGEPGPIMLQGDHGKVDFRKVTITPAQ